MVIWELCSPLALEARILPLALISHTNGRTWPAFNETQPPPPPHLWPRAKLDGKNVQCKILFGPKILGWIYLREYPNSTKYTEWLEIREWVPFWKIESEAIYGWKWMEKLFQFQLITLFLAQRMRHFGRFQTVWSNTFNTNFSLVLT